MDAHARGLLARLRFVGERGSSREGRVPWPLPLERHSCASLVRNKSGKATVKVCEIDSSGRRVVTHGSLTVPREVSSRNFR